MRESLGTVVCKRVSKVATSTSISTRTTVACSWEDFSRINKIAEKNLSCQSACLSLCKKKKATLLYSEKCLLTSGNDCLIFGPSCDLHIRLILGPGTFIDFCPKGMHLISVNNMLCRLR